VLSVSSVVRPVVRMHMRIGRLKNLKSTSGQSLVETALMAPLLLMFVLNAINFGYFFFVAVNLAAAPRSGAEYSILGFATPGYLSLPAPGGTTTTTSVSYLTLNDMTGALASGGNAEVQVCTAYSGVSGSGSSQTSNCNQYNSSPTYTPNADPEAPNFILNRVDVTYKFTPLISGTPFNIVLLASPICSTTSGVTCTFHRQASMRVMN
jgi:hypothetical protein